MNKLDFLFHPASIAIIGVSANPGGTFNAGECFLKALLDFGYPGKLYAVGISGGEAHGHKIYASIKEITDSVDYVIAAIPNRHIPQLIEDCGQKEVKAVHMFTSGFSEIEDESGTVLQKEIVRIARRHNMRLIGPNCMGIYCPGAKISFAADFSHMSGNVGYLSQSGGQSIFGTREANRRGVNFSKVVSYGNACDVNECDLIEYFTHDPETDIITAYIEGTTEGPRLFQALKQAAVRKPVIVFKGGTTEAGKHATVSHTSAIAGSNYTWDSMLRQTGVIQVNNIKEMFDVVAVLQHCPEPRGLNTLIIGHGGGAAVQSSDECYRAGLNIPLLPAELRQALMQIYHTEAGNIFKNPVDVNLMYGGLNPAQSAFKTIADWEGIDIILIPSVPDQDPFRSKETRYTTYNNAIIEWGKLSRKPILVALRTTTVPGGDGIAERCFNQLVESGMAVFPSVPRAATAIVRAYQYYRWHKRNADLRII